ncbi:MAG: hypothetical protein ACFFCW_00555 [Candidatus Hodarchaeota archaeon]
MHGSADWLNKALAAGPLTAPNCTHVEELTGLNFFNVLPNSDEKAIEKTVATSLW